MTLPRPRPRRLFPPAPLGSMLKRVAAAAPITRVRASDQDENYLSDVRDCPCLYCGMEPSEPAHVRFSSAAYGKTSGLGKRPESKWVLPVCAEHHRLARTAQHNRCEQEFWHSLGINPLSTCVALYAQRGDQVAMRAVVMVAIAGRDKKD